MRIHDRYVTASFALALLAMSCSSVTRIAASNGELAPSGAALADASPGSSGALSTESPASIGSRSDPVGESTGVATGVTGSGGGTRPVARACTKPVKIGVSYAADASATVGATGGSPEDAAQADIAQRQARQRYTQGVDDLNKRGGLGGCKVQLVFYGYHTLAADGWAAESQRECTAFAEDHKVFVAFPGANAGETRVIVDCLKKHGIPTIGVAASMIPGQGDSTSYRGYWYQPSAITTDRLGVEIDVLRNVGYFDKGAKPGILLYDDAAGKNRYLVNKLWKPKLAAIGFPNPEVFSLRAVTGASDLGRADSEMSSAVLQFQRAGVTHVLATPDGGAVVGFFTPHAESQQYRPRYALNSYAVPSSWGTNAPQGQRARAIDISFAVTDFNTDAGRAKAPMTQGRSQCDKIYKAQTSWNSVGYSWCDALEMLRLAFKGNPQITVQNLLRGVEAIGSAYTTAAGYGTTRFGAGRYDGLSQIRALAWDETHQDWVLAGQPVNLP